MILLLILQCLLSTKVWAQVTCQASYMCSDGMGNYNCIGCETGALALGDNCPGVTDAVCQACTITSTPIVHTFTYDPAAPSSINVGSANTIFTSAPSCGGNLGSCTHDSPSPLVTVAPDGEISVDVSTSLLEVSMTVQCFDGSNSGSASITVKVVCGANSTTLTSSTFPTSVTTDLTPTGTPKFGFVPYTSSEASCPVSTVGSDSTSATWSSHFVQTTAGNELIVSAGERFLKRTLSFFIVFQADGGATANVACTLTTRCVAGSVPLDIADYPAQQVEVGSGAVYYQSQEIVPTVTGCPVTTYHVGSASDHTATPTGLSSTVTTSGGNFRISPSDATAKQTYSFYIWIALPDSAYSSVGPVELKVGCTNYIDATVSQDTGALTQTVIGSQGTANKLELVIDETNINTPGSYRLNLNGFGSTKPADCPPDIATYSVSTSNSDSTLALAQAQLEPFTAGASNFEVTLSTTALGTYQFYIWGQDSETRWDNVGISTQLTIEVLCGSETISTTSSSTTEVLTLSAGTQSLNFQTEIVPLFQTTKAPCPITTLQFYSDSSLLTTWSDSFMTLTGSNLAWTGAVVTTAAAKKTVYVQGTSAGGSSASVAVDLVVCGNEQIAAASSDTLLILDNATGSATFNIVTQAQIETLFTIDSSSNSHADCLIGTLSLSDDSSCSSPYTGTGYGEQQNPPQFNLLTQSPSSFQTLYFCLTSKGAKVASKRVQAEVCGSETAIISDPSVTEISRQYSRGSGTSGKQTILFTDYNSTLRSSSNYCPLASFSLVNYDAGTGVASPYDGSVASILASNDIEVSTASVGISNFYVEGTSTSGTTAYLKFKIEIIEVLSEEFLAIINTAPFFEDAPGEVAVTQASDQATSVTISLPEILDSTSNFCGFFVESEGLPPFLASNSSNLTEWQSTKSSSTSTTFSYSFTQNTLTVQIPSSEEEAWGNRTLQLTLIDSNEASTTSSVLLLVFNQNQTDSLNQVDPGDQNEENGGSNPNTPNLPRDQMDPGQDLTAAVKSLTAFGELTISFSEPIKTEGIGLEDINAAKIELYVRPQGGLQEDEASESSLNFTWAAAALQAEELKIKIEWNNPSALSPNVELDELVIQIIDEGLFVSQASLVPIRSESRTLKVKIPRQIKKTSLVQAVDETARVTKAVMQGATWTALVFNVMISGFLNMMLGLINSLQLIVHLPAFNIAFPPNAFMVFGSLIPIVTFDLLEAFEEEVDKVLSYFKSSEVEEDEDEVPQQFQNVGFEAYQPLPNLGTLGVFVLLYLAKLILFCLSTFFTKLTGKGKKFKTSLRDQLFFSEILLIFIEGYLDFCLAAFLFLSWPQVGGGLNWTTLGFIAVLAFVIIPGALLWIGSLPAEKFKEEDFRRKWSVLFEDIRTDEVGQRLFFLAFVIRRLAYVAIAFSLRAYPSLQIVGLNLTNLGILIYQGYFKPIQSHLRNFIEATNEGLMCLACFHLMAFTDMVADSEMQYNAGWSMALLVGVQISFNFGAILKTFLILIAHKINAFLKKLKNKFRNHDTMAKGNDYSISDSISSSTPDSSPRTDAALVEIKPKLALEPTPLSSDLIKIEQTAEPMKPPSGPGITVKTKKKNKALFKRMPGLPASKKMSQPQDSLTPKSSNASRTGSSAKSKRTPPGAPDWHSPPPPLQTNPSPMFAKVSAKTPSKTSRPQVSQMPFGKKVNSSKPASRYEPNPSSGGSRPWLKPSLNLTFGQ